MMKKTNLFKTLTAITTAALMFAIPVSSAFADVHGTEADIFRSNGSSPNFIVNPSEGQTAGATSTGDVYIIINNQKYPTKYNVAEAVYKVDVEWTDLTFTYTGGTWNPDNHTYSSGGTLSNGGNGSITVTNHSNWAVKYSAGFADNSDTAEKNGFTATLTNYGETSIDACDIGVAEAPSETIGVTVTAGDVTATENFTLGTITVKITPDTADGKSNAPTT